MQTASDNYFCMTSKERSLKHGKYLSDFYYDELKKSYPESWNKENPPGAMKYSINIKCYEKAYTITGKINYTLNQKYNPKRNAQSIKVCEEIGF
jgi:hypothetical protein